jgi:hypothetical protein
MTQLIDEFQVIIKLDKMPLPLRLTYPTYRSNKIIHIEELDALENVICGCKFVGRTKSGDGCHFMVDIKRAFTGMRPLDWQMNDEVFVDSFYKIH